VSFQFPEHSAVQPESYPNSPLWAQLPRDEVPGLPALRFGIAGKGGRVLMRSLEVYTRGFFFVLETRLRKRQLSAGEFRSARGLMAEFDRESEVHDRLLATMTFADGSELILNQANFARQDPDAQQPLEPTVVLLGTPGGSDKWISYRCRLLWVPVLPPQGNLTVHVTWPYVVSRSRRLVIDAVVLHAAAKQVVAPW
jgi:hypothetical protein